MKSVTEQILEHFDDFIEFVGPRTHAARREEYAQYCRGLVAASMIGGIISVEKGRELNLKVNQVRDQQ